MEHLGLSSHLSHLFLHRHSFDRTDLTTASPQFTIIEPALFKTGAPGTNILEPPHPAYANPELPVSKFRAGYPNEGIFTGDPRKFAKVVLDLADVTDERKWPFRVPLHRVAVDAAKCKGQKWLDAAEREGWRSDDIYIDKAGA